MADHGQETLPPDLALSHERLRDPLTQVTRKQRRSLLGVSAVGLAVTWTGLIPTKITALGIVLGAGDQRAMLFAMSGVVLYFIVAFFLYATPDRLAWRLTVAHSNFKVDTALIREDLYDQGTGPPTTEEELAESARKPLEKQLRRAQPVALRRGVFEFYFPLSLGLAAVGMLWIHAVRLGDDCSSQNLVEGLPVERRADPSPQTPVEEPSQQSGHPSMFP